MGIFNIIPDSVSVSSGLFTEWTAFGVAGADLIAGLLNPTGSQGGGSYPFVVQGVNAPPPPYVVTAVDNLLRLGFSLVGNIISLDGAARISFAGLPAGFQIDTAVIHIFTENNASDATNHFKLQYASLGEESGNLGFGAVVFSYPGTLPISNLLNWWNNGIGIHVDNTVVGQQTSRNIARLSITGTWSFSYSVTSITPSPLRTDQSPIVISLHGTNMNFFPTGSLSLHFTNSAGAQVVTLPDAVIVSNILATITIVSLTGILNFTGTATLFSGSVSLGTLSILYATGSGIYRFVANQRHDTLYDRTTGSTTNVAIPMPFAETGFIGG
jgi:hypothetical protein